MAWAAQDSTGRIVSVGMRQEQLPQAEGIRLTEIADAVALAVMHGERNMQTCLGELPPLPPPAPFTHRAAADRWTRRYPSMMDDSDADAVSHIAGLIPQAGIAVEVGSRLGGTAKNILDHALGLKRLYCIDPEWGSTGGSGLADPMMDKLRPIWQLGNYRSCRQHAEQLLGPFHNVRLLALTSPYDLSWWTEPVDFVFEDATHANPVLRDNLDFWVPKVRSGGIIAGHDYAAHWAEVVREVDQLRDRLGAELHVQGTVWWMIKP